MSVPRHAILTLDQYGDGLVSVEFYPLAEDLGVDSRLMHSTHPDFYGPVCLGAAATRMVSRGEATPEQAFWGTRFHGGVPDFGDAEDSEEGVCTLREVLQALATQYGVEIAVGEERIAP